MPPSIQNANINVESCSKDTYGICVVYIYYRDHARSMVIQYNKSPLIRAHTL